MTNISIAPGIQITAEDFFLANTTSAIGEKLSGVLSQTDTLNILGEGQIVTHFSEYAFSLGERTFRYIGDFTSTIDQGLLGSISSLSGNFHTVVIEEAGHVVAQLDLDALVGIDFGSLSVGGLLGLDLGAIADGLLGSLLGDGLDSLLDALTGSVDGLLEEVQDLIGDESDAPAEVTGEDGNDTLDGYGGNDYIRGLGGDDVLHGKGGNDAILGDGGNDKGYGEEGNDLLRGGAGRDQLWGGAGDDEVFGDQDNDKLYGDSGNDRLVGGSGSDQMFGGDGDDTLLAGSSRDRMTGGLGADTFIFTRAKDSTRAGDLITDFNAKEGDQLDFSRFKHADFIGRHQMSHERGEIQISYKHGDTYVRADFNGDGKGEFVLHLDGHLKLTADDFIL